MPTPLNQTFFSRNTITVARELVGCELLVRGSDGDEVSGRIVEVEAYEGENDPASHAGRGNTPRSEIMFGPAGFAYVYLIYGMHHCLNFVTEAEGTAGAVLIRGLEPLEGKETMAVRRGLEPGKAQDINLCSGPGRLCRALGIDLGWNGLQLGAGQTIRDKGIPGEILVTLGDGVPGEVVATPRIGISKAVDRPWRFVDPTCKHLGM